MNVCERGQYRSQEHLQVTRQTLNPKLRRYEERLRQQEKQIERSMKTAVEEGRRTVAEDTLDPADQAVLSYHKEMIFSQGTEVHAQLFMVRLALERIHEGSFGECMHCGSTIGEKRLEALPWTPYCIDCQEKLESGEIEAEVRAA